MTIKHLNLAKHYPADQVNAFYNAITFAYNHALEDGPEDKVFNPRTQKEKCTSYRANCRSIHGDEVTFKIGTTVYNVANTKAAIRLLGQRLGMEPFKPVLYNSMKVWNGCNGLQGESDKDFTTRRVRPAKEHEVSPDDYNKEYLPLYFSGEGNHKDGYVLFCGALLYLGKYCGFGMREASVVQAVMRTGVKELACSKALYDAVGKKYGRKKLRDYVAKKRRR